MLCLGRWGGFGSGTHGAFRSVRSLLNERFVIVILSGRSGLLYQIGDRRTSASVVRLTKSTSFIEYSLFCALVLIPCSVAMGHD